MAKQTAKPKSRWQLFTTWCRCHKIRAGLAALVLLLVVYLVGSWIVLQVQAHVERNRFITAAQTINEISSNVKRINLKIADTHSSQFCTKSNFGGVFENYSLTCEVKNETDFINISGKGMYQLSVASKTTLKQMGLQYYDSKGDKQGHVLNTYNFDVDHLNCALFIENMNGTSIKFTAGCSGKARKVYFQTLNN